MSTKHAASDDETHPRADKRAKPAPEEQQKTLCPHCELDYARPEEVCAVCQRAICSFFCGLTPKTICNVPRCRVRLMCHEPGPFIGALMAANSERCGDCEAMYCVAHKGGGRSCSRCATYLCASFLDVHPGARGEAYCIQCKPYDAERAYSPVAPAEPVDFLAPDAGADDDGGELDIPEPTLESTKKGRWVPASASVAALRRSVAAMEHAVRAETNVH